MKVLQINTVYRENSTGRTCYEVEKALEERGYQSLTIHQLGSIAGEHNNIINSKYGYYVHKFMARLTGLDGYYSKLATRRAIKKIEEYNPDIIHLRNLHGGYIHLPTLFSFLSKINIPIIYNLHDTWAYTGKCPEYANAGCEKWKDECSKCPQYKVYPVSWFFDRSRKIFNDKIKWYKNIKNLVIVGVSDYMKAEALKAPLFLGRRVERIYNWIDLNIFQPNDGVDRKKYGIQEGFLVIGCSSWWKKNTEYDEMCELARMLGDEAQVVMVGGKSLDTPYPNMHHIPYTKSAAELASLYGEADAFVCLSTAESFGKVAAEALACGTPVVVYDTTGIREIPGENCGYVVDKHDLNGIKKKLIQIKKDGKEKYTEKCRQRAEKLFDYETNVSNLIELYEELVKSYG